MDEVKIDPDEDYVKISEVDLQELELLRQKLEGEELKNGDPTIPIKNLPLKIRVSKLCLKLLASTPTREPKIRETCSRIIGAFSWHVYGDKLDDIIKMAKELEDADIHKDEAVYELFRLMEEVLEEYTENNSTFLKDLEKKKSGA